MPPWLKLGQRRNMERRDDGCSARANDASLALLERSTRYGRNQSRVEITSDTPFAIEYAKLQMKEAELRYMQRNYKKGSPVLICRWTFESRQAEKREAHSFYGYRCCYQLKLSRIRVDVVDGTLYGMGVTLILPASRTCMQNYWTIQFGWGFYLQYLRETTTPDVLCFKRHYERRRTYLAV